MRERERLLYEFHRLEQEGVPMTRKFDRNSDLDAMRFEYAKLTSDQSIKSGVSTAKRTAMLVIGGLGSLYGAVFAGLLVGMVQSLAALYWPAASTVAVYVAMVLVILWRPQGLLGER